MLKTIRTDQVTLGMHIHELKGAWVDHPFWKTKFVLKDPEDLLKLQRSVIKEVVIDASKGLDVAKTPEPQQENPSPVAVQVEAKQPEQPPAKTPNAPVKKSVSEECEQAAKIISQSKQAVASMFQDIRLGKVVDTNKVMPLVEEISASITRNENALISLVRLKTADDYTYMHSVAVCALMTALARELGLTESETRKAGLAGLLHDLGKASIPLEVLNKPGALTDGEFAIVKRHPEDGYNMLLQADMQDVVVLDVCLHHHEKIDGTGYPHGLKDEQISLFAKMGAVCDVYDAVTSNRPYKSGWEPGMSIQRMAQWKGHFDERIFKAFVKSIGIYPVGSVVVLKSGKLAVVIEQTPKTLLQPVVKAFFSTKSKMRIPVEILDLSKPSVNDQIVGHESPATWGIGDVHELWSQGGGA